MNKRIILSLGTLAFLGAALVAGTGAFFSDTETSTGNVFTAGSVTVAIEQIQHTYNGVDANNAPIFTPNGLSFTLDDIKPLDKGAINYELLNGANEAYICAMVTETASADNTVVGPELDLGDDATEGELGDFLSFKFGTETGFLADISGLWQTVGTISPNTNTGAGFEYCFGEYNGAVCEPGTGNDNLAQTDSLTADVQFYAVQTRNNEGFTCADLNQDTNTVVVTNDDLSESFAEIASNPQSWFFYNDSGDTVMAQNEFAGTGGTNEIVAFAGSVDGAAKMVLDDGSTLAGSYTGNPRYNIATYQFAGTLMSSVTSLKYRVYDASASGEKPFLNFNVSFDGVDNWQRRLVHVPGASTNPTVPVNTWTEVDAIDGGNAMYTWSHYVNNGNMWPDGNTAQYRSLNDLIAAFPLLQIRTTDSFFGIRVGHPGPIGEENYVDSVEFNGTTYQFNN